MQKNLKKSIHILLPAFCLLLSLVLSACRGSEETQWSYKNAKEGVVRIWASEHAVTDAALKSWGTGSGFAVGECGEATDIFVTNRHVIEDEHGNIQRYIYIFLEDDSFAQVSDGKGFRIESNPEHVVRCSVLYPRSGDSEYPDLAILRAEREITERIAVPLKSGTEVEAGDAVYAMGFPGSSDDILQEYSDERVRIPEPSGINSLTVTDGIVSRVIDFPNENYTTAFQHTAQINHGSSGGPLVTADGYVVGLNTWGIMYSEQGDTPEYFLSFFADYAMQELDGLGLAYDTDAGRSDGRPGPELLAITVIAAAVIAAGAVIVIARRAAAGRKRKPVIQPERSYRLQGVSGVYARRRFRIERSIRLGRDPNRNDLVFPPECRTISGTHCVIVLRDGHLSILDTDSKNGTFLNGARLKSGCMTELEIGDMISLAGDRECFRIDVSHG